MTRSGSIVAVVAIGLHFKFIPNIYACQILFSGLSRKLFDPPGLRLLFCWSVGGEPPFTPLYIYVAHANSSRIGTRQGMGKDFVGNRWFRSLTCGVYHFDTLGGPVRGVVTIVGIVPVIPILTILPSPSLPHPRL